MGGDFGPSVVIPAALAALEKLAGVHLLLVGNQHAIAQELTAAGASDLLSGAEPPLTIKHTDQAVAMNESPSKALRSKPHSSMHLALAAVASGEADACVSAGNTGALMAIGRQQLQMLNGIERPAIISELPVPNGQSLLLDLGANVGSTSEQLVQFAAMGAVLAETVHGVMAPKVALLNVGKEAIKGTEQVKLAAMALAKIKGLNFIGYVEGDELFSGIADVIVCDGFVGNVALKSAEGVIDLVDRSGHRIATHNWRLRLLSWLLRPLMHEIKAELDPRERNGASLIGLRGTVLKSHGAADSRAFATAICRAKAQAEQRVPEQIEAQLSLLLEGLQ